MSSITSEEINYLIYRYLQEAGFVHSAYCFGQESFISKADIKAGNVAPGSLISLLQKGLHYVSIETHLNEDGTEKECSRPFSLLEPHVCERPGVTGNSPSDTSIQSATNTSLSNTIDQQQQLMLPNIRGSAYIREPNVPVAMAPAIGPKSDPHVDQDEDIDVGTSGKKQRLGSTNKKSRKKSRSAESMMMDIDMDNGQVSSTLAPSTSDDVSMGLLSGKDEDVTFLRDGVKSNITIIACAPVKGLQLSLGTGDGWLQFWERQSGQPNNGRIVSLTREFDFSQFGDITTINWRPDGRSLVVANVKGDIRVIEVGNNEVDDDCKERFVEYSLSEHHQGPVFAAKWSPSGSYLLTAGLDCSVAVWDLTPDSSSPLSKPPRRVYRHHQGPVLDVDWRTDDSFATCSVDRTIIVYNNWALQDDPVQIFTGHTDEVNSIAWDPTRTILASCSDDSTARLWKTSQSSAIHTLTDHKKEIYSINWSPVESRSGSHWLATASLDTTVRLWDPETGKCVRTLAKHTDAAFSAVFSPDGDYLATGARDSAVHIWSLREGMVVRSFHAGEGGVTDLSWTTDGKSLIAASSNDICVFDMPQ